MLRHTECPYRPVPVAGAKLSAVGTGYRRGSPLGQPRWANPARPTRRDAVSDRPRQIDPIDGPPID
jgi:hypothetical protein